MFLNVQRVSVLFVVGIELTGGRMNRLIDLRPVELALHHSVIFQSIIFIEVRFCPKILDFTFKVASIVRTYVHLGLKNHKAFRLVFGHFFDGLVQFSDLSLCFLKLKRQCLKFLPFSRCMGMKTERGLFVGLAEAVQK